MSKEEQDISKEKLSDKLAKRETDAPTPSKRSASERVTTVSIPTDEAFYKQELQRLAQHALNVLIAFDIHTVGGETFIVGGQFTDDVQIARSVSEIRIYAGEYNCEGLDLLKSPAERKDEQGGGIFS